MNYRILGRTNLSVSEIGFGGIPIQKINENDAVSIIKKAGRYGVNFIDTGRVYTDSEKKIGLAIKNERKKWIVASKSPAVSYDRMKEDIKTSLSELQMSYIDLYQLHHIKDKKMLRESLKKDGAISALKEFQNDGKIRFIGISSHEPTVLVKAIKTNLFDTIMTSFNYYERESEDLIKLCKKKNIGVIVMKPLAGGLIAHPTSAIRFCLSFDGISTVIPGIHTEKELEEDVINVLKTKEFKKDDKEKLENDKIRQEKYCHACGYCVTMSGGCPRNINIFYFLALEGYFQKFGPQKWIINLYKRQSVKPNACIYCGHCESVCPYGLPIMRILRNLKIRKYCGEINENKFGKRDYFAEKKELDETAKKELDNKWKPPIIYFKYKRGANPGQRITVLKLIREFEKYANEKEKQSAIIKLCREMKIKRLCIHQLKDLVMLADYDNIVDMMRILPVLIKKIKKK
ncbi:MAG: aldo/keto reductase [Candidatus Aenigmatarchaeota archaeon]